MAAREASAGTVPRQVWAFFRIQLAMALAWASATVALDEARGRSQGFRRGLLGLAALWLRAAGGMVWFSIGWLGAAEHGLSARQAALAGGFVGAVAASFAALLRLVLPAGERPGRCAVVCRPLTSLAVVLSGALLAALGAREARRRG